MHGGMLLWSLSDVWVSCYLRCIISGSSLDSSSRVLGTVVEMEPLVSALTNFVSCGHQKLKWAMMFENNLCTGIAMC